MVKQQRSIEEFGRIRLGKPEVVTEHTRTYDVKPKLDKKTKERIMKGKAKKLVTKGEFIETFKDKTKKKKKTGQTNLDKQLEINTKLLDEYGDLKTFDKHQKRFEKITPNETKEIIFNGEKYTVLASTWEEEFLPITEEDKKESDKWIKEHPNAKSTDYRFSEYIPYIKDKILKKEQKKKEKPKQEKFGSKKIDIWNEEDYEKFRKTPTYQERMGETKEYFIKRIKQEQKRNPELLESLEAKNLESKSKDELLFMLIQREVAIYNELAKIPLNIKKGKKPIAEKKPKQEKKKEKVSKDNSKLDGIEK